MGNFFCSVFPCWKTEDDDDDGCNSMPLLLTPEFMIDTGDSVPSLISLDKEEEPINLNSI